MSPRLRCLWVGFVVVEEFVSVAFYILSRCNDIVVVFFCFIAAIALEVADDNDNSNDDDDDDGGGGVVLCCCCSCDSSIRAKSILFKVAFFR